MAKFKDIVTGLSRQTIRKVEEVGKAQDELNRLLENYQRYCELSARIGPESESAQIGAALLFNVPIKLHSEVNPYPLSERDIREMEDAMREGIEVDPKTLDLGQYPLWKIMREILRQVPEMRVYELEAHLRQFGIVTSRSALESCLKTHRKQFRVRTQGREKFVAWEKGARSDDRQRSRRETSTANHSSRT
jgi:hypothetical protein